MNSAMFRFYEELNDFLAPILRGTRFEGKFENRPSIKDAIEALGVPHTEVDVIIVNNRSVDFSYRLQDGDDVAVYPVFEAFDVSSIQRLRPAPLRTPRFIGDVHLGRLCRMLRIAGFDTLYRNDYEDRQIVAIAASEHRIVLTRDRGLLKHAAVTHGYCVRSTIWREQLHEVFARFDLWGMMKPFSRCAECNGEVLPVAKAKIADRIEEKTRLYFEKFSRCTGCGRIYWEGSHFEKLRAELERLRAKQAGQGDRIY